MRWLTLSRVGWGAVAIWAVVGTGLLGAQRSRLLEQEARLEGLERTVSELRASRPPVGAPREGMPSSARADAPARDVAGTSGLSEQQLDALSSRVAALLVARQSEAGADPASKPHLMPASEHQAALQHSQALLEEVLARGRLSQEDVLRLRREMAPLEGTPEAEALRKRLVVALNLGQVVPDDPREPLLP
jgi:hypothetical protein